MAAFHQSHGSGESPTSRRAFGLFLAAFAVLQFGITADAQEATRPEPQPVLTGTEREIKVATGDGYLAWQRTGRDYSASVFVQTPEGETFKVNPAGKDAALGDIDDGILAYQLFSGDRFYGYLGKGQSEIRLMDLGTREDVTPSFLASRAWEYLPSMSDGRIFFGRATRASRKLMVADLEAEDMSLITSGPSGYYMDPGQINGEWVIWTEWDFQNRAVAFKLKLDRTDNGSYHHPNASYWATSITEDGVAYLARDHRQCGVDARLMRENKTIYEAPPGRFIGSTYVDLGEDGLPQVYFAEARCRGWDVDIYKLRQAVTVQVSIAGNGTGTVDSAPAGIDCGTDCSEDYRFGTVIRLTAQPGLLSKFAGWTGQCEGQGVTCDVLAWTSYTEDITANFTLGP
jgi:Divergent InlB B-repeat domain